MVFDSFDGGYGGAMDLIPSGLVCAPESVEAGFKRGWRRRVILSLGLCIVVWIVDHIDERQRKPFAFTFLLCFVIISSTCLADYDVRDAGGSNRLH